MKTLHILKYAVILVAVFFVSCDSNEDQETIFAYFPQAELTLKMGTENAVEIPVKVFSTSKIYENLDISYTIVGAGADQIEDMSGGSIHIEKGFEAYIAYIKLAALSNENADGDLTLSLELQSPNPRVVTGLGNQNTNKSLQLNVVNDNISCLASLWKGSVTCHDDIYPSYSPSSCSGEVVGEDCQGLKISFDFWADANLPVLLDLELSAIDNATKSGTVILLDDFNVKGSGYDITFYKGDAGTYNAESGALELVLDFTGYDIGGDGKYRFTIKK